MEYERKIVEIMGAMGESRGREEKLKKEVVQLKQGRVGANVR